MIKKGKFNEALSHFISYRREVHQRLIEYAKDFPSPIPDDEPDSDQWHMMLSVSSEIEYLEKLSDALEAYVVGESMDYDEENNSEALDSIPKLKEKWEQGIRDRQGENCNLNEWEGIHYGAAKLVRDRIQDLSPIRKQQFFYDAAYNWQTTSAGQDPDVTQLGYRIQEMLNELNHARSKLKENTKQLDSKE